MHLYGIVGRNHLVIVHFLRGALLICEAVGTLKRAWVHRHLLSVVESVVVLESRLGTETVVNSARGAHMTMVAVKCFGPRLRII